MESDEAKKNTRTSEVLLRTPDDDNDETQEGGGVGGSNRNMPVWAPPTTLS
jgi:hypothetical protein